MCCPTVTGVPEHHHFLCQQPVSFPPKFQNSETPTDHQLPFDTCGFERHQRLLWFHLTPGGLDHGVGFPGQIFSGLPRPTRPSWSWHLHPRPAESHPDTGGEKKKTRLGINPCFPEMISRNITQLLRCLYHVSKSLTKSTKMYSKKSHLSESVPAEMAFPCLLTIIHPGPEPWKNHWCNSSSPESSWRQLRAKKRSKNTNGTPVFPRGALQKKEKSGKADEKDEKIQCFAG